MPVFLPPSSHPELEAESLENKACRTFPTPPSLPPCLLGHWQHEEGSQSSYLHNWVNYGGLWRWWNPQRKNFLPSAAFSIRAWLLAIERIIALYMCARRTTLQIIVFFTTESKNCTACFLGRLSCVANIFKHFVVGQTLSLGGGGVWREREGEMFFTM